MVFVNSPSESLPTQWLDESVCNLCKHDGGNALDHDDDLAALAGLHTEEGALYAIEGASNNLDRGALGQVDLVGGEIAEMVAEGVADGHELLHLILGDRDGDVPALEGAGVVLKIVGGGLQLLDALPGGVDEEQVVDGGD